MQPSSKITTTREVADDDLIPLSLSRLCRTRSPSTPRHRHQWKLHGQWNRLGVSADATPLDLPEGSKEEFITQHFWGYSAIDPTHSGEYQVEHPRWRVWRGTWWAPRCVVSPILGTRYWQRSISDPSSVLWSHRVERRGEPGCDIVGWTRSHGGRPDGIWMRGELAGWEWRSRYVMWGLRLLPSSPTNWARSGAGRSQPGMGRR